MEDIRISIVESNFSQQGVYDDTHMERRPSSLDLEHDTPWTKRIAAILKPSLTYIDLICYYCTILYHSKNASIFSLPLPLMVLLWGALKKPRPSATFWNIIIAYFGVATILKWLFKLKLLSWQDKSPWFPTLLIDLKTEIYNIFVDLILLLFIILLRCLASFLGRDFKFEEDGLHDVEEDNYTNLRSVIPAPSPEGHLAHHSAQDSPEDNMRRDGSGEVYSTEHRDGCFVVAMKWLSECTLIKKCCYPVCDFFRDLIDEPTHCGPDVYKYMFLCEIINFVVTIFEFRAFGSDVIGESEITEHLLENKVPTRFLVLLILQIALIIVDRALYLCRCMKGKIIFHFCLVVGVHVGVFFLLPSATHRKFNTQWTLQLWYMVKCYWFLLSAYQIRHGYPSYVVGNFLCSRHGLLNFFLIKGFLLIPFLFELRTALDWQFTDTSLSLSEWLKMEGLFYTAFQVKCLETKDETFPCHQGAPKKSVIERLKGGGLVLLIIGALLFPMILFSFSMYGNELPSEVTITMQINSYPPIYTMSVQRGDIISMNARIYSKMHTAYMRNEEAMAFLSSYTYADVAVIRPSTVSESVWNIAEQQRWNLIDSLQSNASVNISIKWSLSWEELGEEKLVSASGTRLRIMEAAVDGKPNPERVELLNLLKGEQHSAVIFNVFPKFIQFSKRGKAPAVPYLMDGIYTPDDRKYRNVTLHYRGDNTGSLWEVKESCSDPNYDIYINKFNIYDIYCHKLTLFIFNDQPLPKILSFLSKTGVIGLYIGAVYVLSRIIRAICGITEEEIMFHDMMNVDHILEVCSDIHKARENRDFIGEKDLYKRLFSLFRLPEAQPSS